MEEYAHFEIEGFRIYLQYPEWWECRWEEGGTHLFFDEYVGSFRITPVLDKRASFSIAAHLENELKTVPGSKRVAFGKNQFVYHATENRQADGHITCMHHYLGGQGNTILVCSFAHDKALLEDEFSAEGVAAALEEVEILLQNLIFGEDD